MLALTSLASLMVALDALVVATALGTIRLDLGASIEALQWTMNAYNLSFAVLLLTGAARERLGVAACRNAVLARIEAVGPGDDLQQQRAPRPAEGRLPFFAAPPGFAEREIMEYLDGPITPA